jgi:hypothetical protein
MLFLPLFVEQISEGGEEQYQGDGIELDHVSSFCLGQGLGGSSLQMLQVIVWWFTVMPVCSRRQ